MQVQLSRDSNRFLCKVYRCYLERRKEGVPKSEARCFPQIQELQKTLFPDVALSDVAACITEISKAFDIYVFVDGSFELSDAAIIRMENRFKNGIAEITDFLAKFL